MQNKSLKPKEICSGFWLSIRSFSKDSPTLQKNTEVTDLAFQRGSRGNLCLTTFALHHSFFPSITLDGSEGPGHDGVYNENTEADNKRTFNYSLRKSKIWWLVREWSFKWNHRFMLEISQLYSAIKGGVCVCVHTYKKLILKANATLVFLNIKYESFDRWNVLILLLLNSKEAFSPMKIIYLTEFY